MGSRSVSIGDLRMLHYASDQLREIFFSMVVKGEDNTEFIPKKEINNKELGLARDLILQINEKIIDLDCELPNAKDEPSHAEEISVYNILEILSEYYKEYDCIIEYGHGKHVTIKKDMVIGWGSDKKALYYYANDDDLNKPPLGVILVSSINAIKRGI